jgi:ribosomal silencing factor RsfS
MKKSTFIDYTVIMAARSHRKKKNLLNAEQQRLQSMQVSHTKPAPGKDTTRKIIVYSRELVA